MNAIKCWFWLKQMKSLSSCHQVIHHPNASQYRRAGTGAGEGEPGWRRLRLGGNADGSCALRRKASCRQFSWTRCCSAQQCSREPCPLTGTPWDQTHDTPKETLSCCSKGTTRSMGQDLSLIFICGNGIKFLIHANLKNRILRLRDLD